MKLITRADFDGFCCAMLLKEMDIIDQYQFVHPKDVQDGKIKVTKEDVLANMPYAKEPGLWFDHHASETARKAYGAFTGKSDDTAPSCARVVYEYYGGSDTFAPGFDELVRAADMFDSAALSRADILQPSGWLLLAFILDPRTGLERFTQEFSTGLEAMIIHLVENHRHKNLFELFELPAIKERAHKYFEQERHFKSMLSSRVVIKGNAIVLDVRDLEQIPAGNRFLEYALFPDQNVSLRIMWGPGRQRVVIAVGKSIINRSCKTDIGALMLKYGGGGHRTVGTCQVKPDKAPGILAEIFAVLNSQ